MATNGRRQIDITGVPFYHRENFTTMQPATLYQRKEAAPVKWSAKIAASPVSTPTKAALAPTLGKYIARAKTPRMPP